MLSETRPNTKAAPNTALLGQSALPLAEFILRGVAVLQGSGMLRERKPLGDYESQTARKEGIMAGNCSWHVFLLLHSERNHNHEIDNNHTNLC